MALSNIQAREGFIIASLGLFLDRNVKRAYDIEVATGTFPTPLTIGRGKPDDKSLQLKVPRITVDTISGSEKDRSFQIGSDVMYRHMNFVLYCYPATVNGEPDIQAADLLKSYVRDAFGTSYIQIVDYSNPDCSVSNILFCSDPAEVTRVQDPVERKLSSALAEEAHRFDFHVSVRYPVLESHAT